MNYRAEFTTDGTIVWDETRVKSPDLGHLQGAMFKDRPDLWPSKAKRKRKGTKPLEGQLPFAFITDPMPECAGPKCQAKEIR